MNQRDIALAEKRLADPRWRLNNLYFIIDFFPWYKEPNYRIGSLVTMKDETLPVFTAWDLGYNDSTAIWFFQILGKEIRLIEYLEGSGESLSYWPRGCQIAPLHI
jgi:hypothetical protein